MIKLLFALLCLLGAEGVYGQDRNPVDWQFSARKIDGKTYEVSLKARIQPPWHIYAQDCPEDLTLPTSIQFTNNPLIVLQDKPKEVGKLVQKKYPTTGLMLKYYAGQVEFVQVVKLKSAIKTRLEGKIDYMACTDAQCLPPMQRRFTVSLQ